MPGPHGRASYCVHSFYIRVNEACDTNDVILPHEENHGITLRRLKQLLIPITQILQRRALKQLSMAS